MRAFKLLIDVHEAEIQSLLTKDIDSLRELLSDKSYIMAKAIGILLFNFAIIFYLDWKISLFSLSIVIIIVKLSHVINNYKTGTIYENFGRMSTLSLKIRETFSFQDILLFCLTGSAPYYKEPSKCLGKCFLCTIVHKYSRRT